MLCIFGDHTCVPISLACKTQTAVSHSSTEAEVISLDARLRLEGLLALTLWDKEICVSEPFVFQAGGNPSRQPEPKTQKKTHPGIH